MLRGLRRAFSKGHTPEIEHVEVDTTQFDEPVAVRPKVKAAQPVATPSDLQCATSEAPVANSNAGPTTTAAGGGKAAWNFSDLGENAAPPRPVPRSGASALSASPPIPTPGPASHNKPSASSAAVASQTPSTGAAWGSSASPEKDVAKSVPDKDAGKHHSKLSGLFRSGSKNSRAASGDGNTAIEPMGNFEYRAGRLDANDDDQPTAVKGVRCGHSSAQPKGSLLDECEPAARGGALRAGLALEPRRGSAVIG